MFRNEEALLEQLRVNLGHVECRHALYPATPPVYRAKEEPPTPPPTPHPEESTNKMPSFKLNKLGCKL